MAVQESVLGLYLPPVFKLPLPSYPPHTTISLPVHTAVCQYRPVGALVVLALGVGGFLAVRYTQQVGSQLTSGADTDAATGRARVRFVKDPKPIPELTMTTLDGKTITTKDLEGKVTIFNFWATWCAPCRAEIPDLVKLQDQYKDHLVIVGVLSEDDPGPHVSRFAADYKMNYPILLGEGREDVQDAYGPIWGIPASFISSKDGKVCKKHMGIAPEAVFEKEVLALM